MFHFLCILLTGALTCPFSLKSCCSVRVNCNIHELCSLQSFLFFSLFMLPHQRACVFLPLLSSFSLTHLCGTPRLWISAIRYTSHHACFVSVYVFSLPVLFLLFPASVLSSFLPSIHCGARCGCLNPNFTVSTWVSAREVRQCCLCQLFTNTWSWQAWTTAATQCEQGKTEQRKETDKGRKTVTAFDNGVKKGQSVMEIQILACDERQEVILETPERDPLYVYLLEYFQGFDS